MLPGHRRSHAVIKGTGRKIQSPATLSPVLQELAITNDRLIARHQQFANCQQLCSINKEMPFNRFSQVQQVIAFCFVDFNIMQFYQR